MNRWHKLMPVLLVLASLAYVGAVIELLQLQFIANDDVTIMDFAAHGFTVRYAGILFTSLCHLGYLAAPDLPWFPLALYAADTLAICMWLMLLFRVIRPLWLAAVFGVLLCAIYLRHLVYLDYTAASVMLCMASLCWACADAYERRPGKMRYLLLGLGFVLGMWIRPHGGWGALAYGLPIALWVAMFLCRREQPWRIEARRLALVGLLFLAPVTVNLAVDGAWRAFTATPQQQQYDAFNAVRGKVHRLSRARKAALMRNHKLLRSIGWTPRDLAHLLNWTFLDERRYTPQALQALLDNAPPAQTGAAELHRVILNRINPRSPFLLLMLASLPLVVVAMRRRAWPAGWGLLLPAYGMGLTIFMVLTFAFPARVENPFLSGFAFASLVITALVTSGEEPDERRWRMGGLALCLVLAAYGTAITLNQFRIHYRPYARISRHFQDKLRDLNASQAGDIIMLQSGPALTLEMLDPLQPQRLSFQPIQLGWTTFSPRFYHQIGALGVQHAYEVVDAMVDNPHAYLLGGLGWCKSVVDFASQPSRVQVVPVKRYRDGMVLCSLRQVVGTK